MVSGYCKCGFPATHKCPTCGLKLCGNCNPAHIKDGCKPFEPTDVQRTAIEPSPVIESIKRKPGRPPVKK